MNNIGTVVKIGGRKIFKTLEIKQDNENDYLSVLIDGKDLSNRLLGLTYELNSNEVKSQRGYLTIELFNPDGDDENKTIIKL